MSGIRIAPRSALRARSSCSVQSGWTPAPRKMSEPPPDPTAPARSPFSTCSSIPPSLCFQPRGVRDADHLRAGGKQRREPRRGRHAPPDRAASSPNRRRKTGFDTAPCHHRFAMKIRFDPDFDGGAWPGALPPPTSTRSSGQGTRGRRHISSRAEASPETTPASRTGTTAPERERGDNLAVVPGVRLVIDF